MRYFFVCFYNFLSVLQHSRVPILGKSSRRKKNSTISSTWLPDSSSPLRRVPRKAFVISFHFFPASSVLRQKPKKIIATKKKHGCPNSGHGWPLFSIRYQKRKKKNCKKTVGHAVPRNRFFAKPYFSLVPPLFFSPFPTLPTCV